MSVTPSTTIVGAFRDQSAAEQAVNALYNSGFGQEQIQYMVPGTSGSFFEGLKNFLTGTNEGGENLADDLTGMGLPDTDAQYYANEYNNGNPILIVRAAERGTEAINVLRQYGAYNTQTEPGYAGGASSDMQPSDTYTQQDSSSSADIQPADEYAQPSSSGAPGQHDIVQDLETQSQEHTGEEHSYTAAQPENAASEYDLSEQDTVVITPVNNPYAQHMDTEAQDAQANTSTTAPAYGTDYSASETDTATREQESETPASPLPSAAPQEYGLYQDAESGGTVSETDVDDQDTDYTSGGDYGTTSSSGTVSETDTQDQDVDTPTAADYQTAQTPDVAPVQDTYDQSAQATPAGYETESQNGQAAVSASETSLADSRMQADTTTPGQDYSSQVDSTTAQAMTEYDTQPQQSMQSTPAMASQATEMQPAQQVSVASPGQADELQQLQAELQALQQQLQEAKARLAAAKEQENQMRTAREREQQLQAARQQLQDAQAELQATLAEYQETQSRLGQYQ